MITTKHDMEEEFQTTKQRLSHVPMPEKACFMKTPGCFVRDSTLYPIGEPRIQQRRKLAYSAVQFS